MAINQASFFLFPPRFGPSVENDHSAKTASGSPLKFVGPTLVDPDGPTVQSGALRSWLESRGFAEHARYGGVIALYFGRQETFLGIQGVVELSVPLEEKEIQDIYIRFLLTQRTPSRWNEWEDLVESLGRVFGFRIMGPDTRLLPCSKFFTLLKENENFQMFQSNCGWGVDRST